MDDESGDDNRDELTSEWMRWVETWLARLTPNFMSLPSWSIGCLRYHRPQYLFTRQSFWFGIQGTALNWLRSYLSSCCFHVKCNNSLSSLHTCLCGVPQGSVLGPLLFVMYTTPLSTVISSLSLNHHLYADDTQLFLSFYLSEFHSNITHLQNALQQISSWTTANLRTLNSSKTEFFLLSDLHNNFVKYTTLLSLQPTLLATLESCIMCYCGLAVCSHVDVAT